MSQAVGFVLAVLIGVTLGMLGGGGSILTVPVFVYVMGLAPKDAIAMSLPVVGTTSLVGALGHWRDGNVDWRAVAVFGPLAMVGAFGGAWLATFVSGSFQLVLLGIVMLAAGVLMLQGRGPEEDSARVALAGGRRHVVLGCAGLAVGVLTGLVGVGGGFLIVPALVLLVGVPMKRAIGTSLLVISLSTMTALAGYHGQASISWRVVVLFTALAVAGTLAGTQAVRWLPARGLRRAFGVLVLALAAFLLYENRTAGGPSGAPAPRRTE
jgi:uncharacterized membrane protein YfcA